VSQQSLLALKSLYAANGFIAVLLYLPQIVRACRDRRQAASLSLITFGGWSAGSIVTALYAWFYVHDSLFTAVSVGNAVGSGTIFLIILHGRFAAAARHLVCRCLAALRAPLYRHGTNRTELAASLSTSLNDSTT